MKEQCIRLNNATFYAYHGVLTNEQASGGKFEVDVEMFGDFSKASQSDKLKDAVDYEKVYRFIKELVIEKRFYLIESLGTQIAESILKNFLSLNRVIVRVRKHTPQVGGVVDFVEFETERTRVQKDPFGRD
ncbi:MAG: dihydroneopterin aldolase [Bacteroidetes bacterium]|nr:dihydroneopterin aldolase [Bacteroidota bacterium]MCL5738589.1 dihydroneopterin aldolase [Bacteroidota bacterium]